MTLSSSLAANAPILVSPIVSTQWLCDHLGADSLVVLDATVLNVAGFDGRRTWLSGLDKHLIGGHIPGALFADLIESFSDAAAPYGFARPALDQFEAAVTALGITNGTTVVVYDNALGQWAARLWWLFRAFGYDNVAVLNGGLGKWNAEDRPVDTGYVEPAALPEPFLGTERPDVWVDKSYVEAVVDGRADALLICALPAREFAGESCPRARPGHIPGSLNIGAAALVDGETRTLLRKDALRSAFAPVLDSALAGERVVLYCGAGISAASDALALTVLGATNVAIYDGSLNEWAADPGAPLETAA